MEEKENYTLVVDTRETSVSNVLEAAAHAFVKEQLDIGDFIIRKNHVPLLILERKTWSDLHASIVNKRHQQQRQRMLEFVKQHPGCLHGYIIEGKPDVSRGNCTLGAMENLAFRYRFAIVPSPSVNTTADILRRLLEKTMTGKLDFNLNDWNAPHVAGSLSKKSKVKDCVFYHQLLVVPHVGEKMAVTVSQRFENAVAFCAFLTSTEDAVDELAKMPVVGTKRKLGVKCATRLYSAFVSGMVQ